MYLVRIVHCIPKSRRNHIATKNKKEKKIPIYLHAKYIYVCVGWGDLYTCVCVCTYLYGTRVFIYRWGEMRAREFSASLSFSTVFNTLEEGPLIELKNNWNLLY